jgi:sugar/nucleoside kinase (ribokinase family)
MPEDLGEDFFQADFTCFGGTALVPGIHDNLTGLLQKAKQNNCFTIVNTVFDFRNEKKTPDAPWPLGKDTFESLRHTDMLIMDMEEAARLSGTGSMKEAVSFFLDTISGAFVITRGADPVIAGTNSSLYKEKGIKEFNISREIVKDLQKNDRQKGDTTGCGDNFAGGIVASLARQKARGAKMFSLQEAISWGVVSGGYTCFYMGGTYIEQQAGEKARLMKPYLSAYQKNIAP